MVRNARQSPRAGRSRRRVSLRAFRRSVSCSRRSSSERVPPRARRKDRIARRLRTSAPRTCRKGLWRAFRRRVFALQRASPPGRLHRRCRPEPEGALHSSYITRLPCARACASCSSPAPCVGGSPPLAAGRAQAAPGRGGILSALDAQALRASIGGASAVAFTFSLGVLVRHPPLLPSAPPAWAEEADRVDAPVLDPAVPGAQSRANDDLVPRGPHLPDGFARRRRASRPAPASGLRLTGGHGADLAVHRGLEPFDRVSLILQPPAEGVGEEGVRFSPGRPHRAPPWVGWMTAAGNVLSRTPFRRLLTARLGLSSARGGGEVRDERPGSRSRVRHAAEKFFVIPPRSRSHPRARMTKKRRKLDI